MYELTVSILTILGFGSWGTYFYLRRELFDQRVYKPYKVCPKRLKEK